MMNMGMISAMVGNAARAEEEQVAGTAAEEAEAGVGIAGQRAHDQVVGRHAAGR